MMTNTDTTVAIPIIKRSSDLWTALGYYYFTLVIIIMGMEFGYHYVALYKAHPDSQTLTDVLSCYANWDGRWYQRIATEGYTYSPNQMSSVAFSPLYPLLASFFVKIFNLRSEWALLIVSHAALIGAYFLFLRYLRARSTESSEDDAQNALLAFAFFPMTFFFRMTYTESLFVLLLIASLLAIRKNVSLFLISLLIALAIVTRSVGVALVPVFLLHLWEISRSKTDFVKKSILYIPLCFLGLIAYMTFLALAFSDPFAFSQTQQHWVYRHGLYTSWDKLKALVTLLPLRDNFDPSMGGAYWGYPDNGFLEWLNIRFVNLFFWFFAVFLTIIGWRKKWLNRHEIILATLLLAIPVLTIGISQAMTSQGRYMTVAFPIYIVFGKMLTISFRFSQRISSILVAVMLLFLFIYTSLFAAWHWYY